MYKLLENDARASSLLAHNPFLDGAPPKFVRAVLYEYSFASPEQTRAEGVYWNRRRVRNYLDPQSLRSLQPVIEMAGWA